ncbi:MAG: LPXTG cell wall anchor domain-containing protein [Coriobacteriales bacterium]|nr:LPXTG cell wall anchor domain-containing protein [Coriobacteriales bacterium]
MQLSLGGKNYRAVYQRQANNNNQATLVHLPGLGTAGMDAVDSAQSALPATGENIVWTAVLMGVLAAAALALLTVSRRLRREGKGKTEGV